ncbi:hypothetical protein ACEWY4_017229 [Coilia grayii]|uniref:Uncharacterized protein n=1 Tax=Coilia grayii TaxID=363190 RepID=A0ABD1JHP6_9TELE
MGSLSVLGPALALVLSVGLVKGVMSSPDDGLTVNCSSTGYPAVPCPAPADTETLDLSLNNMEKLPAASFPSLHRLKRLLLQFNQISSVDPSAFQQNPVLEYLDISHNRLPHISALPFASLPALTYLDISDNAYEEIVLEDSFDPLGNLRTFKLGSSSTISIRKDRVKRLGELRLKEIHLVAHDIAEYEQGSLMVLKNLDMVSVDTQYAQISDKHFLLLEDISGATKALTILKVDIRSTETIPFPHHLQTSSISKLIVRDIFVNGSICKTLPSYLAASPEEIIVENVHAEGECYLILGSFDRCRLRKLFVKDIDNKDFLRFIPQPTLLKLMECFLELSAIHIGETFFPCEMADFLVNLKALNVSVNELTEWRLLSRCLKPFPALQSFAIDHNIFQHLGFLGNATAHMENLVNFTASYNRIHLEPQVIAINWTKSLRRLNLRNNQLTDEVFQFLPQTLEMLDVSYNDIHVVCNVQGMSHLQELLLSGNKIMALSNVLLPSSVRLLHVDRNNMSTISEATFLSLSLTELDFSGNPLHCDCDTPQLARFCSGSTQTKVLHWPSGYRCQSPDSLRNQTLQQASLPWPTCHTAALAVIIVSCICLPMLCCVLFKKLRGQIPNLSSNASYGAVELK